MSDLTLLADHHQLRQLRPWLDDQASHLGPSVIGRVELCVHELATNVIDHSGATKLSLHLAAEPSKLTVELRDFGVPVDLSVAAASEPHPRIRGYGMMIAEQLASELTYERRGTVNVWRATFELAPPPSGS